MLYTYKRDPFFLFFGALCCYELAILMEVLLPEVTQYTSSLPPPPPSASLATPIDSDLLPTHPCK